MFKLIRPCNNCPFRKGIGEAFQLHPARLAMARGGTEVRPLDVEPEPILEPRNMYVAKRSRAENGAPLPGKQRRGGHRKRRGK